MRTYKNMMRCLILLTFIACKGFSNDLPAGTLTSSAATEELEIPKPDVLAAPATIQIALLLDTSGSMSGLINQARMQLWNLVNKMSNAQCNEQQAHLEIALYEYGNNNLAAQDDYIRQVVPFSTDLDMISKALFALSTSGGDEYCGAVIDHATRNLEWRNGKQDLKMIFIAGNESFLQGSKPAAQAMEAALQKDITVNTIFCGDAQVGISLRWKEGAIMGKGEYTVIDQNRQTHYAATPYDQDILDYNNKLNETYVFYGAQGYARAAQQEQLDAETQHVSAAANVNRSVVKSKSVYKNASWDLIDAASDEHVLEKLIRENKETLATDVKDKSVEEIKKMTLTKKKQREEIQKNILALNAKREVYLQSQSIETNELESAMVKAIQLKAAAKKYTWK